MKRFNYHKKIIKLSLLVASLLQIEVFANEVKGKEGIKELKSVEIVSNTISDMNSYTVESMNTATMLDLSIKETPQSITVLTAENLNDFNITSY